MKTITFICILGSLLSVFNNCTTKTLIDKKADLTAKIEQEQIDVSNALAKLESSSFISGKKQLSISASDSKYSIRIYIKDYRSDTSTHFFNGGAVAVLENKTSGVQDSSSSGNVRILFVQEFNQIIPGLPFSQNSYDQYYKAELIGGTFNFLTKNNILVSNGVFGITFNK